MCAWVGSGKGCWIRQRLGVETAGRGVQKHSRNSRTTYHRSCRFAHLAADGVWSTNAVLIVVLASVPSTRRSSSKAAVDAVAAGTRRRSRGSRRRCCCIAPRARCSVLDPAPAAASQPVAGVNVGRCVAERGNGGHMTHKTAHTRLNTYVTRQRRPQCHHRMSTRLFNLRASNS